MSYKNVMFVIADDWSRIARCYGNEVIRTPRIDAFAERGVVFDYGFCTSPSCAVSRACILTGQHSHTHGQYGHCHGIHGFRTHEHMQSVPKILKSHGFATACIGKKHVEPLSVYPFDYEPKVTPRSPVDVAEKIGQFLTQNTGRRSICILAALIRIGQEKDSEMIGSMPVLNRVPTLLTR